MKLQRGLEWWAKELGLHFEVKKGSDMIFFD